MYNTILVPLDGSKRAEVIMRHVQALAIRHQSKVVLMQVVEPTVTQIAAYPDAGFYYQAEMEARTKEAEKYLAGCRGELANMNLEIKTVIEHGPVVRAILDVADREKADLIAMTSHGRSGLVRVFYGSVAAGVLHQTGIPILMVRAV